MDQRVSVVGREYGDQPQDLDIQPHQCDEQPHGGKPFHIGWRAILFALFEVVEIEQEVQCCYAYDQQADADADYAAFMQVGHVYAE